jgi:hypothetical protein
VTKRSKQPQSVLARILHELQHLDAEISMFRAYREVARSLGLDEKILAELRERREVRS